MTSCGAATVQQTRNNGAMTETAGRGFRPKSDIQYRTETRQNPDRRSGFVEIETIPENVPYSSFEFRV